MYVVEYATVLLAALGPRSSDDCQVREYLLIDLARMVREKDRNYEYHGFCLTRLTIQHYMGVLHKPGKEFGFYGVRHTL